MATGHRNEFFFGNNIWRILQTICHTDDPNLLKKTLLMK